MVQRVWKIKYFRQLLFTSVTFACGQAYILATFQALCLFIMYCAFSAIQVRVAAFQAPPRAVMAGIISRY